PPAPGAPARPEWACCRGRGLGGGGGGRLPARGQGDRCFAAEGRDELARAGKAALRRLRERLPEDGIPGLRKLRSPPPGRQYRLVDDLVHDRADAVPLARLVAREDLVRRRGEGKEDRPAPGLP